jgi:hypothetical protein
MRGWFSLTGFTVLKGKDAFRLAFRSGYNPCVRCFGRLSLAAAAGIRRNFTIFREVLFASYSTVCN